MLVAFLILPYGCERDEEIDISTKAKFNAPSITLAKHHVEQHTTLKLRDPNNFFQSRDLEGSLTVDWELSGIKEYKDEPEQQVDILYTPIYINNNAEAKMFVGSEEYNGEIKSNIFCLIYTDLENTTTFSGYILRFDLNGALLEARKYQNGSIVNPQDNTSEGMSRTNCDNETIFDMLIMLLDGGGSLSNWHGCLDTVVVYGSNTSIDAGDSTGGGSPLDSAIVTSINIPELETNSNNPAGLSVPYWYTQSVTANGFNISLWLEIHPLTPIAQWLMTEATTNQLQQIANFLNAHKFKIRDEYPVLDGFDGFEPADSPTASTGYAISEAASGFALIAIEAIQNGGEVDFEDLLIVDSSFKNNPKVKSVYDRMKSLNGTVFSNLLSQFDNSKNAKLTLKVANIPQPSTNMYYNAKVLPRFGGGNLRTFDIVLDEQFVQNASLIEIALTLVHEMIHAEIMERCIQLGIITGLTFNGNWEASLSFSNGTITSTDIPTILFATLISNYSNYLGTTPNSSSNWQHDLYNLTNYRAQIAVNIAQVHPLIDNPNNPFENNLNEGTMLNLNLNMNEYFNLISWLGLEATQDYNGLPPLVKTKISQAFNQTRLYYNRNYN
jgi:hypothetical protein